MNFIYVAGLDAQLMDIITRNFKGRILTDDVEKEITTKLREHASKQGKSIVYEPWFRMNFSLPVNGGNLGVRPVNVYSLLIMLGIFVSPDDIHGKDYIDIIDTRYSIDPDGNPKMEPIPKS